MAALDRNPPDDDYNPHGEHVVEIPARHADAHATQKRSYGTLGVAVFIGVCAVVLVAGLALDHSARKTVDAARQNQLRDGWQTLSALAAEGAEADQMAATAAAASARAASPNANPIEVMPVVQTPAPTVVVVPVPAATANQSTNPAPQAAATNTAATPIGVPIPVPALPNAALAPQTVANAPIVSANGSAQPASAPTALPSPNTGGGSVPASNPVPPSPVGAVPAAPPNQSLPSGAVPPAPFPAAQLCGITTCNLGSVCCNPSCGTCTAPGAACSLQPCG